MFTDREHVDSSQHASLLSDAGESGTQCQCVDGSGKHTHLVAFHAVEALACTTQSTEDVATSDDDADLDTHFSHFFDLLSIFSEAHLVDAILFAAHE